MGKKKRKGGKPVPKRKPRNTTAYVLISVLALAVIGFVIYRVVGPGDSSQSGDPAAPAQAAKEVKTPSGLRYVDEVVGTGASPRPGSSVTVNYTGTLTNGTKFDSSYDRNEPFTFQIGMGRVIKGWDEGVMTMKVGGKRKLIVPPELGYGRQNMGKIPPNSTLNFEVELLNVQ